MKKTMTKAVLVTAALAVAISGTAFAGDYEYRNAMDMDKFVAALKDARDVEYRNVFDIKGFVAALGDPCQTEAATLVLAKCETGVERTPLY
jgi:hypothetical protein